MSSKSEHEHYKDLIQIQALDKEIKQHLDAIQENNNRITHLESQRTQRETAQQEMQQKLEELTKESNQLENQLVDIENKIAKSEEHLAMASTQHQADAINKELETLKPQDDEIQERILEIIDQTDQLKSDIQDCQTFLAGSLETLNELSQEMADANQDEQAKIEILEGRIENLLGVIPAPFKTAYLASQKEHRFQNPIAFIQDRCCNQCRFAIDITIQDNVSHGVIPEQCPSCSRLLLPLSATTASH